MGRYGSTFAIVIFASFASSGCRTDVSLQQEVWSPDSTRVARFWQLAGGGAAGFVNGYVEVRPRDEPFQPFTKEYAFVNGGHEVSLIWRGNDHLHIKFPAWHYAGRRCPSVRGVVFTYEALAEPDSAWSEWTHSDFAYHLRDSARRAREGEPPILSLYEPPDTTCAWARREVMSTR